MAVARIVPGALAAVDVSILDPVSPPAESIRDLAVLVLVIIAGIFVVVEGLLVYALVRFRAGRPAASGEPAQLYGSTPIEIAWTVAPTLVVVVLTLVILRTLWDVKVEARPADAGAEAARVTAVGHQWWWEYRYDGFVTANELHVPASADGLRRPAYLDLLSADVCHSFWVPRLAGKTDLIPGRRNRLWFETAQAGVYLGQCAEFCGTQHAKMLLRVSVDPRAEYERWAENQRRPAVDDPRVAEGKRAFLGRSCVNCHRVRGTPADGSYAPDLTHLMSRHTLAAGTLPNTRDNLRRWVADPQSIKPGCLMPAFGLDERELDRIVDYLTTLR
jgi:cytochrome c oxidase subunit 2